MEQAGWLQGVAELALIHELRKLANDQNLLLRAIIREVDNINAGLGFQAVAVQAA